MAMLRTGMSAVRQPISTMKIDYSLHRAHLDTTTGARLSQPQHVRLPREAKCNPGRICPSRALRLGQPRSGSRPVSTMVVSRRAPLCLSAATALLILASLCPASAQTQLIVNGGFESGTSPWVMSGGAGVYNDTDAPYERSGLNYLWMGGVTYEIDFAYQTITIPSSATSATFSFYYNIFSQEDT